MKGIKCFYEVIILYPYVSPSLFLGLFAQFRVKSTYTKLSQVHSETGETGAQVARRMLDQNGLQTVRIEQS